MAAMHSDPELTLDDLARESGAEARTIRGYVQRGLVPRPSKRGRGATYPPAALDRVRAIRRLMRESGIGLDEIRRLFFRMDDAMIRRIGSGEEPVVAMVVSDARLDAMPEPILSSAVPEEEPLRRRFTPSPMACRTMAWADETGDGAESLGTLMESLQRLTRDRRVHPGARAEEWVRVRITPDLELGVRGPLLDARGRTQLEEIADHLRALLTTKGGDPEA